MEALYSTEALSTGAGRDGRVAVAGSDLAFDLAVPKEMGGSGAGANPEQLFAAGYAACFHSALQAVARGRKISIEGSSVGSRVSIGSNGEGGFELAVQLEVVIPELDHDTAQELADAAHQVCPYSNATRGNIDVRVTVTDD
ncbi:organic hydroperoxide resistance protein [Microbacterium paludicola]|uniref:Organic hydroperoxide resistance protein n=1 Tax=Microbacterium paludicola TaxID=300019 RepID=A0A4Y9FT82_9MICO|nr:organic hydroperoxide resistance protein [Microbacterium paludicola]MBF0817386.1 organic hydroperoxide resistance protein [Microbacterium paludicola]TFU31439.1 organic hydroperoxide resistance protein [Microbacterium paludicola]